MPDTIRCPQCGAEVEIAEALAARLREQVRGEVLAQVKAREEALSGREAGLKQREQQTREREADLEQRVQAQVAERLRGERAQAEKEARAAVALELGSVRDQLAQRTLDLTNARKAELDLRRQQEALERDKADLELSVARRLAEERGRLTAEARRGADEQHALALREKEAAMEGLRRTIDELKRKAEQGSQQLQGEVLETSLEDVLRRAFPSDRVEPVAKGVRGADVVQRVCTPGGAECGVILWESKRTKAWATDWLPKLRDDQRALKADVAALVSQVLPRDAPPLTVIEGVWVTGFALCLGLAQALRKGLLDVAEARRAQQGQGEKMGLLYAYFTGPQFRNRVEGFLEPLKAMKDELDAERRAMERLWAKRQQQIDRALLSVGGLYGDVQGISAGALPELDLLELPGSSPSKDGGNA